MKKLGLVMRVQEGGPRRNASLAKQSRDRKVWSDIKSNVPDNSIDEDKYKKGTKYREATKYLKRKLLQSCCHHIKGFTANSLAALMRK